MAVLSKGQAFATGDQVTALKLNDLVDDATFVAGAVDNASTQLSGGAIIVKDGGVTTAKIADDAVINTKIENDAVTTAKIEDDAVTTSKIEDDAVTTSKIENDAVTTSKILDANVTTVKILDANVTTAKIEDAAITAPKLSGAQTGTAPVYGARAWVNFNGTTSPPTIRGSGNVSSVVRTAQGTFTINFETPMLNTNYAFVGFARDVDDASKDAVVSAGLNQTKTTSQFVVNTRVTAGGINPPEVNIIVIG